MGLPIKARGLFFFSRGGGGGEGWSSTIFHVLSFFFLFIFLGGVRFSIYILFGGGEGVVLHDFPCWWSSPLKQEDWVCVKMGKTWTYEMVA